MIDWLETFDNSTASYDRAFSENVLDSLVFGYNDTEPDPQPVNWYTLQYGPFPSHPHYEHKADDFSDSPQRWL